jgi:hypothetical protein
VSFICSGLIITIFLLADLPAFDSLQAKGFSARLIVKIPPVKIFTVSFGPAENSAWYLY